MIEQNKIYHTDCLAGLQKLPDGCSDCCITSPPYFGLRDYGHEGQIGLEKTPEEYVGKMVEVFREVKRVLKNDGTLWLNIGDSYNGSGGAGSIEYAREKHTEFGKPFNEGRYQPPKKVPSLKQKDLIGIPWMVAFALRSAGWYLRQDIIWHKPNPMPESVTDRCTKAHEYIFLLSKSQKYYFDPIQEVATGYDGRNDTKMNGSQKYSDGDYLAAGNANSLSKGGRERWKYKNLSEKGQQPNSMHLKRLVGEEFLSPVRNKRSVWTVTTKPFSEAHFATFPEDLIIDCIKAGCPEGGVVLDPFMGAGTTALVAAKLNRNYIGFELNADYIKIAEKRLRDELGMFNKAVR